MSCTISTREPGTRVNMELQEMNREWKDSVTNPPKDGGRYWCHVVEHGDLGESTYQWNCYYDKKDNNWSDNLESMKVTHWTEFLDSPKR